MELPAEDAPTWGLFGAIDETDDFIGAPYHERPPTEPSDGMPPGFIGSNGLAPCLAWGDLRQDRAGPSLIISGPLPGRLSSPRVEDDYLIQISIDGIVPDQRATLMNLVPDQIGSQSCVAFHPTSSSHNGGQEIIPRFQGGYGSSRPCHAIRSRARTPYARRAAVRRYK